MIETLELQGAVPVLHLDTLAEDARSKGSGFRLQIESWGFMAAEIPGIGAYTTRLMGAFSAACGSTSPRLLDYAATLTPQVTSAGNHGFYKFNSEIPRLAQGVPDPKEFLHVSGAMIDDVPTGSHAVLEAFPDIERGSVFLFNVGFILANIIGDEIRAMLPGEPPGLNLSRHSTTLRVIHYKDFDDREVLAHEHSGIQMLGVQFPPSDGGLQYILHDGTWVEPCIKGTDVVLCNVGRMLAQASGGRLRPSTHRVHRSGPPRGTDRSSVVLFVHPDHNGRQWRIEADRTTYLDATWGDFVSSGFRGIGLRT
jgi:hypothetical protein